MNERNNNGRGIFYGVIGVATLVVAIIGATFAYFTASANNENVITGNMASIDMGLTVTRVVNPGETSGMIPMSNNMVEAAVSATSTCTDDNGNAVCQIYKVVVTNESTAGVFVDGYVALIDGSGTPTDYMTGEGTSATYAGTNNATTMRWAQVFTTNETTFSTAGTHNLGTLGNVTFTAIGGDDTSKANPHNVANIRDAYKAFEGTQFTSGSGQTFAVDADKGVIKKATYNNTDYGVIGKNYIRVSNHDFATDGTLSSTETYRQESDVTSALVYNQQIAGGTAGAYNSSTYYFVVWLSETGTNQTAGAEGASDDADDFFQGQVKFISAQGSEVSATFGGYTRVPATYTTPTQNNG